MEKKVFKDILATDGWYGLIIPKAHINFDSMEKLSLFTDFAISALKIYIDKYCKYCREQWEAPRMKYLPLLQEDNNFVTEYTFTFTPEIGSEMIDDEIIEFIRDLSSMLDKNGCIPKYEMSMRKGLITAFDFRHHLYAPLISIKGQGLKIAVSPISLN